MLTKNQRLIYALAGLKTIVGDYELETKVKDNETGEVDIVDCYKEIETLIVEFIDPQPYKFEELKKGMWVWDDKGLYCFECNPAISKNGTRCVTYNAFWYNCGEDEDEFFEEYDEFKEGRFFPITKALEYQE